MRKLSELETQKLNRQSLEKAENLCKELSKLNLLPSEYFVCDDDILLCWTRRKGDVRCSLDAIVGDKITLAYVESDSYGISYTQYLESEDPVIDIGRFWV